MTASDLIKLLLNYADADVEIETGIRKNPHGEEFLTSEPLTAESLIPGHHCVIITSAATRQAIDTRNVVVD